jgi:hypothetical protein
LVGALALGGAAVANPVRDKPEKASSAVKRVGKAFSKLKSYRVAVSIQGGQAQGAEHRITQSTVNQSYQADVVRSLCRVASPQAYRPRSDSHAGAIEGGGGYKAMLATDAGRLLARLFLPAEQLLAEASRFKKTARWVDEAGGLTAEAPRPQILASRADDGDAADEGGTRTGQRGRSDGSAGGDDARGSVPHRIRVKGPSKVALEHFLTIQNSGCFTEG